MESTIQKMNIYDDGVIEIIVKCNECNHTNYHTLSKNCFKKKSDKITIDFSKLGKRVCDNFRKPKTPTFVCNGHYKLYK